MTGTLDRIEARPLWSADYAREQLGVLPTETNVPDHGQWWVVLSAQERDALVEVAKAAQPALELLAAEGYDRHHEGGFPVCAEYENLAAALARLEES